MKKKSKNPNYKLQKFVETYLNKYYSGQDMSQMEFPQDYEIDMMYNNMHMEYMRNYGSRTNVSQTFNNPLWLILIGALYRRFPNYRGRCRHDRRYCRDPRHYGRYGGGYNSFPWMPY